MISRAAYFVWGVFLVLTSTYFLLTYHGDMGGLLLATLLLAVVLGARYLYWAASGRDCLASAVNAAVRYVNRRGTQREETEPMRTPIENATAAAQELATLIRGKLPIDCGTERWPALGWALLARMAGTTETIIAMTPDRPSNDTLCLLRILYEHVVTFAWIAAGPVDERVNLFRKHDAKERIKADDDLRTIGDYGLEPATRAELLALRDSIKAEYPNLVLRAEAADLFWKDRVEEFVEDSASPYSFRGMYRQLYRHASSIVHPSLLGLSRVTTKNLDGTRSIHMEAANERPFPIGLTAVILGAAVIVSEHALGWPAIGTVDDIVARHNWVPPRPESNPA